ncbi:Eco57I restriction-modification methylase domain-containing protein [Azonexus hydrophilus]|uniref:Eco57I restriction-modification methylase domain-containing protein n=1 Tax=Azonexus hydrophilus TaxID=418702 RepID=UPI0003FCC70D|nr:DNA methyltransferase [Azonexus hydrophilus]
MARRNNQELAFPALSIEGGLLAPDFLNKVAHLEAAEQTEADYDIPRGLKLRDEIGRYWKIAQNLWQDFAAKRARTDVNAHAVTVKDFLEPLLRHGLCFGDLKAVSQVTLDERLFPIGFAAGEGRVPVVLAAHDQSLDKPDARFGDGVRRRSPFLLAQEYLNASEGALWAVVGNGLKLRILRDNASLTRPAYIEADLEAIFGEGLYPDFTALWLLAHASRFGKGASEPGGCPLERWRNTAQEDGIRARDRLRVGVTEALRSLGTGFLAHPANAELRHRIEAGELSAQAYFEQLLRLIYRFIFLATIEDREVVFAPEACAEAKARYLAGYSLSRLRQLAARRRSYDRHADLWQVLTITFSGLSKGQPALGLPALGGLFAAGQCPDLDAAQLDNAALLSALFSLCFFRDGSALSRVNYRDMDSEELGSVYESLLELVPQVALTAGARHFGFIGDEEEGSTKGNARKLTGSYYTPDSLVQELVKSALEPVIERTLAENPQEPVKALLALSICDPACGSGHFLLAAARRIAEEVARLNASDGNPQPGDYRFALREVVAHCIYGVDKNPMAVELAKTALWLEAYTPERPLTFLDAHLRCGDALLGVLDPAILDAGIPDRAFNALSGDDKEVVKRLKKANRDALKAIEKSKAPGGQFSLGLEAEQDADAFEHLPDDTLAAIETKRAAFAALQETLADSRARLAADLFVAAFVLPKTADNEAKVPTSQDLWLVQNGSAPRPGVADVARHAAETAQAFHWWQAFPQVRAKGSFNVLLGNPPWERIKLQEEEFFASRSPLVAEAPHKAERGRRIQLLAEGTLLHTLYPEVEAAQGLVPPNGAEQALFADFLSAKRSAEAASLFAHDAGRYPLTGVGDVNTYALFAETFAQLVGAHGRAGFIVPTGIATDDSTKAFFAWLTQTGRLASLYDIENREAVFPSVHRSYKFCLLTLGRAEAAEFVCFATQTNQLADPRRRFTLNSREVQLLSPVSGTAPVFRSGQDKELSLRIAQVSAPFVQSWASFLMQGTFHSSGDSGLFEGFGSSGTGGVTRLYEPRMFHQYDHRYAEFNGTQWNSVTDESKRSPDFTVASRYRVPLPQLAMRSGGATDTYSLTYRRVSRNTDERTLIAAIVPTRAVNENGVLVSLGGGCGAVCTALVLANFNTLVTDYQLRQKDCFSVSNSDIRSLAILPNANYDSANLAFIVPRVLELTYTAHDLAPWAADLGYTGEPFSWNPERRAQLRAELDAYYARLYGLTRDELRYILDPADVMGEDYPSETFRVLKNNEMREFGEYRTRRLVLEAWDRLEAESCQPSVSVLSEQGLIRSAEEADFAGIVVELIRQHSEGVSAGDLQTLVAYAMQPQMVTQLVDQPSAARLTTLMNWVCRIDVGTAIQLIPSVLHRLQTNGVCRLTKRGDVDVYVGSTDILPADVRCTQEHAELGGLLLALDAKRKAIARADLAQIKNPTVQRGAA